MKNYFFVAVLLLIGLTTSATSYLDVVKYASIREASAALTIEDVYTNNWSRFDLESRVQKKDATKGEQFANITKELLAWTEADKKRINGVLRDIDKDIKENAYLLDMPSSIQLIKSTLKDEGGAEGYTRANNIVLSTEAMTLDDKGLRNILLHELFHLLTRHSREFKAEMYGIIGFQLMNEVAFPSSLKEFKISNPDAPYKDSYIKINYKGIPTDCMMILYSDREYEGGSFFEYLHIGLLKLTGNERKEVELSSGNPIIYDIQEGINFFEQIGTNTPYIIDPEEALADNFVFAINDKKDLPSPEIVEAIQRALKK